MTESTPIRAGWAQAAGSCGFNISGPVFGAYVKGVALYVWQSERAWTYCVTGHLSGSAHTQAGAMVAAEAVATRYGRTEADRVTTRKQFQAIMANPAMLGAYLER